MVFGKDVRVEWDKRDKYKRIVGKVWVQPESCPSCPMTLDAGHAQITVGLAWWYRKYANEQSPRGSGRLRVLRAGGQGEARRGMERTRSGSAVGVAAALNVFRRPQAVDQLSPNRPVSQI